MKVWMVIGVFGDGFECSWTKNIKCFSNEEDAETFKKEYDSNPKILYYKGLYRKWLYGGEEIYDDENKEDAIVIGYEPSLTEEERKEFESLTYHIRQNYVNYQESHIEEYEVQ